MAFVHLMVMTIWISYGSTSEDKGGCYSPQHLSFGSRDIIQCSFRKGYYGILWYNTTEIEMQDPVVELVESLKSGKGYASKEYDIYPNGSLIINNVSSIHDQNFTVVKFDSLNEEPMQFVVAVVTVVDPEHRQPVIRRCGPNVTFCFTILDNISTIDCFCRKARPAVNLKWLVRTSLGDRNINYQSNTTFTASTYTSSVTTKDVFHSSRILSLLVCRAKTLPGMLHSEESLILVQNEKLNIASENSLKTYVALDSNLNLVCTNETVLFLTWQESSLNNDQHDHIAHAVFLEKQQTSISFSVYKLSKTGSLIVPRIQVEQEGFYSCLYGDGLTEGITDYEILVYAYPVSAHPVVEGCGNQQFCILEVLQEGNLTCSVSGIRPKVLLVWTVGDDSSELISFEPKPSIVEKHGDTFSITLTSHYRVFDSSENRVIVKCQISGAEKDIFKEIATVELVINNQGEDETSPSAIPADWKIFIGMGFGLSCSAVIVFVTYKVVLRLKSSRRKEYCPETQDIPLLQENTLEGKLISQLKEKYDTAVYPIPDKQDKCYSVNELFITGGIEVLIPNENTKSQFWGKKVSYKDVFYDKTTKSTMFIVEGEAGYGKSTLMLQLVHDWCKNDSHAENILIFLRLRKLTSEMTIFEAIRRFALPGDSDFSDRNIESILFGSDLSVVIILDGFDDYPDKDKDSDVLKIIRRDMLSHCKVVLTTRPGYLHEKYFIKAQRIRLTGFDKQAQHEYIRRAVVNGNSEAIENIKRRLRAHGALNNLWSVPMIFAAFAHISHDSVKFQEMTSLTTIVNFIIISFHSHMKSKMNEDEISNCHSFPTDHKELDKMAFDAILSKKKEIQWCKDNLCQLLGQDFCDYYIRTGIMVEKDNLCNVTLPLQFAQNQQCRVVKFSDNIFCEWFAAHYLLRDILKQDTSFRGRYIEDGEQNRKLELNFFLQVYRFACGLNDDASKAVIQHLKTKKNSDMLVCLCNIEVVKNNEYLKSLILKTCQSTIYFRRKDSLYLQRSSKQALDIAASCGVRIKRMTS
ncbi:Protein NLRC5 [Holothuria leucospilota]|uniref:Protein NLRC5 n=1 Tax=Holothuria leucospilota TaxID=206669 RepID=A0A9Q0Y8T2_HOLLE|nr:Protein NLRC5 [Holothuria leucospilota]